MARDGRTADIDRLRAEAAATQSPSSQPGRTRNALASPQSPLALGSPVPARIPRRVGTDSPLALARSRRLMDAPVASSRSRRAWAHRSASNGPIGSAHARGRAFAFRPAPARRPPRFLSSESMAAGCNRTTSFSNTFDGSFDLCINILHINQTRTMVGHQQGGSP
jgi:hypothetical protein